MRKSNQTETNECKELILEQLNSFSLISLNHLMNAEKKNYLRCILSDSC